MKLMNCDLRPGTILEVLSSDGVIKASVPGLFSAQDIDLLPPIMPFGGGGSNTFSTPNKGDEIWVLSSSDNMEQLYWFRKDNFSVNNGKNGGKSVSGGRIQDEQNVEVITNRKTGTGIATIYFSDGTGWVIQNQSAVIQLSPEGNIKISSGQPHCTLDVTESGISLGTAGSSRHPACHGDKVEKLFENIIKCLRAVSTTAKSNPYTTAIGVTIENSIKAFENDYQYINSDFVTLD